MSQKRIFTAAIILFAVLLTGYLFNNSITAKDNPSETTITGEVIDVSCFLAHGDEGKGPGHQECAIMCAKAGSALAILTANGDVYFPVGPMGKNNNEKLMDYAGDNVEATGIIFNQGNLYGIKISTIKKVQ